MRRCFYEGLPNARRALANCSTLMMFDDHEVTDDFAVTKTWRDDLSRRALGRDVMTNGLAAYLVFQDWGNDPTRYEGTSKNREAFSFVRQMFTQVGSPLEHGPPDDVREELEKLFGFTENPPPLTEQVSWSFSLTDPNITGYELLAFDNRTKRGYGTEEAEPSDLSLEAITNQVPADGPAQSAVTIIVAPLPVVGYPPMEEIVQPIVSLMDSFNEKHEVELSDAFPQIEVDYRFGKLVDDPEAWSFSPKAQESLFDRLSSRAAVVFLSGDIHFSLTGKLTYWRRGGQPLQLQPSTRFVQLISSALKNEKGGIIQALVQLGIAEQLGAIVGGPYDRLGWHEGGVNGPDFDKTGASRQLIARMSGNPAVIPVRMLNDTALQQLRTPGGLHHPPDSRGGSTSSRTRARTRTATARWCLSCSSPPSSSWKSRRAAPRCS